MKFTAYDGSLSSKIITETHVGQFMQREIESAVKAVFPENSDLDIRFEFFNGAIRIVRTGSANFSSPERNLTLEELKKLETQLKKQHPIFEFIQVKEFSKYVSRRDQDFTLDDQNNELYSFQAFMGNCYKYIYKEAIEEGNYGKCAEVLYDAAYHGILFNDLPETVTIPLVEKIENEKTAREAEIKRKEKQREALNLLQEWHLTSKNEQLSKYYKDPKNIKWKEDEKFAKIYYVIDSHIYEKREQLLSTAISNCKWHVINQKELFQDYYKKLKPDQQKILDDALKQNPNDLIEIMDAERAHPASSSGPSQKKRN